MSEMGWWPEEDEITDPVDPVVQARIEELYEGGMQMNAAVVLAVREEKDRRCAAALAEYNEKHNRRTERE